MRAYLPRKCKDGQTLENQTQNSAQDQTRRRAYSTLPYSNRLNETAIGEFEEPLARPPALPPAHAPNRRSRIAISARGSATPDVSMMSASGVSAAVSGRCSRSHTVASSRSTSGGAQHMQSPVNECTATLLLLFVSLLLSWCVWLWAAAVTEGGASASAEELFSAAGVECCARERSWCWCACKLFEPGTWLTWADGIRFACSEAARQMVMRRANVNPRYHARRATRRH
jgi:hypothetical protein